MSSGARGMARLTQRALIALAVVVLALGVLAALFPGALTGQDPLQTDVRHALMPPGAEHWFGTDQSGRDVYARVVHGAGRSLGIGVLATGLALVVGLFLGMASGVAPRVLDAVAMRANDVLMAFPEFLLALVVVALLGPGAVNVAIGVTLASIPVYVRLARAQTQVLRRAEHVEAARILGIPAVRAFADDVLVLRDGVVVEQGGVAEIFTTPRHPFTRALIEAGGGARLLDLVADVDTGRSGQDAGEQLDLP